MNKSKLTHILQSLVVILETLLAGFCVVFLGTLGLCLILSPVSHLGWYWAIAYLMLVGFVLWWIVGAIVDGIRNFENGDRVMKNKNVTIVGDLYNGDKITRINDSSGIRIDHPRAEEDMPIPDCKGKRKKRRDK